MSILFATGYFKGGWLNLPITVKAGGNRVVIRPFLFSWFFRGGEPYLDITPDQVLEARKTRYSLFQPFPAIEIRYREGNSETTFIIGLLWQRQALTHALTGMGIQVQERLNYGFGDF